MPFPAPPLGTALALALVSTHALAAPDPAAPLAASVLVTAARVPQPAVEVLSDHVLISSEDILRSGAASVVDLLQKQRGIEVTRNGGPGTAAQVFIRGAESKQNVVLIDGVRIGSSTTGLANWSALPLANIDRIEIVYGPLATVYGADAIGGVVQIFTRRGAGPVRVAAAAGAGSDKARSAEFGFAGSSEHGIDYAFHVARDHDEGFSSTLPGLSSYNPDRDGYKKDSVSGRISIAPAPGHEAGLLYLHSHMKSQYDAGAARYDVRSVQNLDNIAAWSRHQVGRDWRLLLQVAEASDEAANYTSPTAMNRIATRQHTYTIQNDIAFGAHLLQLLAERREEEVLGSATAALNRTRATDSLAAAFSYRQGAHLASASLRRDDSVYGVKTTGALAWGYRITPALRVNASAGTSFRAPTFNELYFPGFGLASNKPEQGKNAEAGLYYSEGSSQASAVYYRNRLTDLLVNTTRCPVEVASHPSGCAYNVNRATLEGVSVGGSTRLAGLDLHASLDWQDPRDDTTGKVLTRRAQRHAKFGAHYAALAWSAGLGVQLSGRRYDDAANRNPLGGYGLVNLNAAWRLAPDWQVVARWNNVAGKRYELARNYATAGSQLFAGIRYGTR